MKDEKAIIKKLKALLGSSRFKHSMRVSEMVVKLSGLYGVDPGKARLAGLLHDASRYLDRNGMLKLAKRLKMKIDPISKSEPKLLHAALSAHIAKTKFHVKDAQVLKAISSHTLGRPGMSMLEKIVYVADHIEIGRTHAGAKRARRLAARNINKAIVAIASSMIRYLLDNELPVHPGTYNVRDHYLQNNEQKKQGVNKAK